MTPDELEALIYKISIAATVNSDDFLSNDTYTVKQLIETIAQTSLVSLDDVVSAVYFYAMRNGRLPKDWQEIQQDRILSSIRSNREEKE